MKQAHTAVHRIINLFTQAYDEPKNEDTIAILEPFLEKTKESNILSMEKYPELGLYDSFDYASVLDSLDRLKDAVRWYEIFLKVSEGSDMDFMREIAEDRLKEIR